MFRVNKVRQETLTRSAQIHRDNLRKNLYRRLESARAKGDSALVRLLEAEADYLKLT
jgi:hypothetical protein